MPDYYELEIGFNDENYEPIYNTLYLNNISSFLEENGLIKISLPEVHLPVLETIRDYLIDNNIVKNHSIYISPLQNRDWNKEWEKTIEPVNIKDKIIIYPSWKKNEVMGSENKILIEINPKMSFGTGHNETTQLILEMMTEFFDSNDKYMLDFGCGTGILAIAAVKLGVENAIAIDIDEDSIENAKEYIKINNTEKQITLHNADLTNINETGFDVVCTNITSGVIIPNLNYIHAILKTCGKLFITGILSEEIKEVNAVLLNNKFAVKEIQTKAEWAGFFAVKL